MDIAFVWVPATLVASAAQVARNTMQRRLTERIGTVGATQVRFLYGLPFALLSLALVAAIGGERLPRPDTGFAGFLALGAVSQIAATATMLAAMRERSFAVVTAITKTEAVQIAVFGFVVLGDRLSPLAVAAVVIATLGVVATSWTPKVAGEVGRGAARPVVLGVIAGALFALSAVGFRGAILSLDGGSFLIRATTALCWALAAQTTMLVIWLVVFDRPALLGSFAVWRSSLLAGFFGALASQFWFIGFSITAAANIRTLALVEVVMAQVVSRRLLDQATSRRELVGMGLIVLGVLLLLASHR